MLGENGHARGTNLVCRVTVGRHAIAANKDHIDAALLHKHRSHIVALQRGGDACVVQLERREARALEKRAGLVAVHVHVGTGPALLKCCIHGGRGGTVLGGSKRSCVAVGENAHGLPRLSHLLHNLEANGTDVAANLHVLLANAARLGDKLLLELVHRQVEVVKAERVHAVERPEEVDGSGTGGCQVVRNLLELAIELLLVCGINLFGEHGQTLGRGHPNGWSAAHAQLLDGLPELLLSTKVDALHRTGKKCLVDDVQRLAVLRQLHRDDAVEEFLNAHAGLVSSLCLRCRGEKRHGAQPLTCSPYRTRP